MPHKFFPIVYHTALPLVHFQKRTFELACAATGKSEWTREENLILMTKLLWRLATPIRKRAAVGYTGMRLGPFSSNLFLALK